MAIRSLYCNPLIATEDDQYLVVTPSMHQTTRGGNFPVITEAILISFVHRDKHIQICISRSSVMSLHLLITIN